MVDVIKLYSEMDDWDKEAGLFASRERSGKEKYLWIDKPRLCLSLRWQALKLAFFMNNEHGKNEPARIP